jgi:hypothetical protein
LLKVKDAPETARIRYYAAIERRIAAEWRKIDD